MASAFPVVSPASPLSITTPANSPAFSAAAASSKAGLRPDGPAYPSSFSPSGRSQHSRRPSRAERYEALVAQAREVLKRGSVGLEEIGLGFEQSLEKGEKDGQTGLNNAEPVEDRDWRDAVRNLLKVVDGMSQQLSTHDELSKELKVAQSSLLLAESHSEFLEETLRRRDSRSSHAMGRHSSNGGPAPPLPRLRGTTDDVDGGNGGGMFGLGLSTEDSAANGSNGGAKSFFRLPSKRKPTPSTASIASTSTSNSMPPPNPPFALTLRSVSSSPRLGDYSPTATSPSVPHPRFSTSTTASSFDEQLSPVVPGLATATDGSSPPSAADVFALRTHVSSLETECSALRSNNASLKRNNETLVGKCAELEKTKEDLMSELENLSVELFSEANTLVAEERRARAKAEEEVSRLRAEIDSLNSQLTILRQLIASRKASNAASIHSLDPTSPDLPALPASEPETPPMSMSSTPEPYCDSPARMPPSTTYAAGIERPASSVSVASTSSSGRKWFSFGRASSHSTTADSLPPSTSSSAPAPPHGQKPIRSASHPAPSDSLRPPEMQRGDSNSSHFSDASSTSFFSFRSAQTSHTTGAVSAASPDLGGRSSVEEERTRVAASGKGKEKARELDLGIYIPGAGPVSMAKTDSEGGRTVGLKTPVTADYTRDGGMRREPLPSPRGQTGRRDGERDQLEYISSPPLPPLPPATPQISSPTVGSLPTSPTSSTYPLNASTPAPSTASSMTPTFAPPTARPPRSGPTAPRPLAIHTSLTPPLSALGGQFPPLDPTAFGEVGGPRAGEMTAASKSPKSPNALRWTEVAGTLAGGEQGKEGRRPRSRSTSRVRGEGGSMREKERLPPSPALPDGFKEQQQQQPLRPPPPGTARAPSPSPVPPTRPLPPTSASSAGVPPSVPGKLRIDTSSSTTTKPVPPVLAGGVKALVLGQGGPLSARPASPAIADPRPSLPRAASSSGVPTSSASSSVNPPPRSLASALPLAPPAGSGSAAPSPTVSSFPHSSSSTAPSVPPALRPGFLRANSSASVVSSGRPTGGGGGGGGMTPSTSASSIASTATAGTSSSTGTAGSSSGRRGADGRPLSPDGTKAVEDLESLMASILAMDGEGVFGAEEGKEADKGEAK